jgi:ketosteroid isomerase-like protein
MTENKRIVERIFAELATGNGTPLVEAMADDFTWSIKGTTAWSGTYRGKQAVRTELLGPLLAQFADRYTNTAQRIIAEGDHVVVECQGSVTTTAGLRYGNAYCYVIRLAGGKLVELTEYLDTELVTAVLEPPAVSAQ